MVLHSQVTSKSVNNTIFNTTKQFEISGKITNYVPNDDNLFITFRTYDILGTIKDTSALIGRNGMFEIHLFQPFEGDIAMIYNREFAILYVTPGEKLILKIDDSKWKISKTKSKALLVSGKSSSLIRLIQDFELDFNQHIFKIIPAWTDTSQSDVKIAKVRIDRMKEELIFAQNYQKKNKISDKMFSDWVENEIAYKAGSDITFNSFTSGRQKSLNDHQLMEILKEIKVENKSAWHNSSYFEFLSRLSQDFEIMININPAYDGLKREYGKNSLPIYFNLIEKYSSGIARQLMYYRPYGSRLNNYEYYYDRVNKAIFDSYIKQLLKSKIKEINKSLEALDILQKLRSYKNGDTLVRNLINVFEGEKGKFIFVDFWGDWCAPCMHEMPVYHKLIDQFKGKPIFFLFFSVETTKEKTLEVKNKYGIDGKFVTLTDNETRLLNNILGFNSYPSHFIFDPSSLLIDNRINFAELDGEVSSEVISKLSGYLQERK